METVELIHQAQKEGRSFLTETESKKILRRYGVPVIEEAVVTSEDAGVERSRVIGFPVVLKGLGANLTHKTERGLVKVNLRSVEEVRLAYRAIKTSAGQDWEGCIVQPLVEGKREFVAGLLQDTQFGPAVMLGLGGILTEAIGDVTFRIAPLSEVQAREMMDELKARKLLDDFRGESALNREQLLWVLMGLSRLAMEYPEIKEVDINPLIVAPDGNVTAVDALVVLHEHGAAMKKGNLREAEMEDRAREIRTALDVMTHAKSIAVVGATNIPFDWGFPGMFVCVRNFGFPGKLYPINPNAEEVGGYKSYPDLASLPEPVDLVIVSVSAPRVPEILKDCVASGNKNVHIFTSGFKETGEEEGIKLQDEIEMIAREGGLRVVGPNCMGFYVPASRMATWPGAPAESGPVALISQSGANAEEFVLYTSSRYGIHFSKSISYGNALTLDSTDFLDYLAHDDETRIITMYLEGVKDGRRLVKLVTQINLRKPVIIMKAGLTEAGARAVSSHTGSLAGGDMIWNVFCRQTGAVRVDSLEEMADVTLAFHHLGKSPGRKVAVFGMGGGIGVAAADSCARVGLELPPLSPETVKELRKFIPPVGTMIRNPIDAIGAFMDLSLTGKILDLLSASGEIDNFVVSIPLDWLFGKEKDGAYIEKVAAYLAQDGRKRTHGKPLVISWRQYRPNLEIKKWVPVLEQILLSAGIPVYEGFPRALFAVSKLAEYSEFIRKNQLTSSTGWKLV
jgi:acyl-CoA synthetase (NDP forming)